MDKRAFFENWFDQVWVQENLTAVDEILVPEVKISGLTDEPQMDKDSFRAFAQAFWMQCKITGFEINFFFEDGEWVQMHVTFLGAGRQTGKKAKFTSQILARVVDGKIVEGYNNIDFLSLFQQLGLLPADFMARCLSSQDHLNPTSA